jgi:hypothetical protein
VSEHPVFRSGGDLVSVVTEPYPEGDLRVALFRDPAGNVVCPGKSVG